MTDTIQRIKSSDLQKGDLIDCHGCIFRINDVKSRADNESGTTVYWSISTLVERNTNSIPLSWFGKAADGTRTWGIQGNDKASWAKIIN